MAIDKKTDCATLIIGSRLERGIRSDSHGIHDHGRVVSSHEPILRRASPDTALRVACLQGGYHPALLTPIEVLYSLFRIPLPGFYPLKTLL